MWGIANAPSESTWTWTEGSPSGTESMRWQLTRRWVGSSSANSTCPAMPPAGGRTMTSGCPVGNCAGSTMTGRCGPLARTSRLVWSGGTKTTALPVASVVARLTSSWARKLAFVDQLLVLPRSASQVSAVNDRVPLRTSSILDPAIGVPSGLVTWTVPGVSRSTSTRIGGAPPSGTSNSMGSEHARLASSGTMRR